MWSVTGEIKVECVTVGTWELATLCTLCLFYETEELYWSADKYNQV